MRLTRSFYTHRHTQATERGDDATAFEMEEKLLDLETEMLDLEQKILEVKTAESRNKKPVTAVPSQEERYSRLWKCHCHCLLSQTHEKTHIRLLSFLTKKTADHVHPAHKLLDFPT